MRTFHILLQEYQEREKVSNKLLAEVLDVSTPFISQLRQGVYNAPVRHLHLMIAMFDLSMAEAKEFTLSACASSIDPRLLAYIEELEKNNDQ